MQLVKNGPDLPESLLQAHEDGRVVFFCGAGVSYPAGLPGFGGLVEKLYDGLGYRPTDIEKAAIDKGQYDTAIGLLEGRIVGNRAAVRQQLVRVLTPDLTRAQATATHEALLTLGRTRDRRSRLITTNFDRLFEESISRQSIFLRRFQAPLLPVPKNRWDGLVYLHGLLPEVPNQNDLDSLVLSSGDFGLAYLTERWAARFVSELFRSHTVCFVGYSINDPVLRYMMDALAADRLLGEEPLEVFAFGSYSKGKKATAEREWVAKNVTPILYQEYRRHFYLHRSLREWAGIYRDGVLGKERIVTQYATIRPVGSTRQDDFIGRVLWALSDSSGLPAKRFAELDPAPSLDWLEPLANTRFGHKDLTRFGVQPDAKVDNSLAFSLVRRPAPYTRAPWMTLAFHRDASVGQWDDVMLQVARWLLRHLNDPKLLIWVVRQGGRLHPQFVGLIANACDQQLTLLQPMRTLWRLVLLGRTKDDTERHDLYDWRRRFAREGLTLALRLELRDLLTPYVLLSQSFRWPNGEEEPDTPAQIGDLVDWEVALGAKYVHDVMRELADDAQWRQILPQLLTDTTALLRDALDLMRELGRANDKSDSTYVFQPSISNHPQNSDIYDWTALIVLVRDAWVAATDVFPAQARREVERWQTIPYPVFRRLVFFAAANSQLFAAQDALSWLLADEHWWLWSVETQREVMRLLVTLAPQLSADDSIALQQAILQGPPREMFREDIEGERLERIIDRETWLRLEKWRATGAVLSAASAERLDALNRQYPVWRLADDERDEFPVWTGQGEDWREFHAAPKLRRDLASWLGEHPTSDTWQRDDWRDRCKNDFPRTATALLQLAQQDEWIVDRWREALQVWSDDTLVGQSWRHMSGPLLTAPNDVTKELAHSLSWWLKAVAKILRERDETFFALIHRVLALSRDEAIERDGDVVTRAVNHPVGMMAEAALRWWYRQGLDDDQGLLREVEPVFTEICDREVESFRYGRIVLGTHLITLFRVDQAWTRQHLLPLFDWEHSLDEAAAVWKGFLLSPRLYRPLMAIFKSDFLATAQHYGTLGDTYGNQYAALLTFAALEPGDTFTKQELADATSSLPTDGLEQAAETLVRALEGAGEQGADYWRNRIVPYFSRIWPKAETVRTPHISESFARLCIAANDAFPEAFERLRHWLQPVNFPGFLVRRLHAMQLCRRFPSEALLFLDAVLGDGATWPIGDVRACLDAMRTAAPELETDHRFQRLALFVRRHDQS